VWHREERWSSRLALEDALMRERFPQFVMTLSEADALVWRGILEPVPGSAFEVTVTAPARYPYEPPVLHVVKPRLRADAPHVYRGSLDLCVHKDNWMSMQGTVASMVPLAAAWLVAYLHWEQTGEGF
jgi:ubiquitin-protein ligase